MFRLSMTFWCLVLLVLVGLAGWPEPSPPAESDRISLPVQPPAELPDWCVRVPEGTRTVAFTVTCDQLGDFPRPGAAVDIVGESDDPTETGNTILNVILLAIDSQDEVQQASEEITVTVALTTPQQADLFLMLEQGMTFSIRLHVKEQRNP